MYTQTKTTGTYKLEKASLEDVGQIYDLIRTYSDHDIMLPRTEESISEAIRDFFVVRNPIGRIVGCCALQVINDEMAEIRSLAVLYPYRDLGIGTRFIEGCFKEATKLGLKQIFTLTTAIDFFKRFGFRVIDRGQLPEKIWNDCLVCPYYLDCKETALIIDLR